MWDEPATTTFLSDEEKRIVLEALNYTPTEVSSTPQLGNEHSFKWKHVAAAILDWQVCLHQSNFYFEFRILTTSKTWFHCISYWGMVGGNNLSRVFQISSNSIGLCSVRIVTVPSHHHQRTWLFFCHRSASHNPCLCGRYNILRVGGILLRQNRPAQLLHTWLLHCCLCRISHRSGSCKILAGANVRRMLHCSMRYLSWLVRPEFRNC